MFFHLANRFGIYMKKLVNMISVEHPKNEATIHTQLILTYPNLGSGLNETSSLVRVAIKIEFPETWSTAWIMHVERLECLLKLAVVTDVSIETEKLKENPVQVILTDTPPI